MSDTSIDFDLFKEIPATAELRSRLWTAALETTADMPREKPLSQIELAAAGRGLLASTEIPENCLGYAMVMINNAFWLDQFVAVPIERRLLLLPRCLGNLHEVQSQAEALGYRIHIAEGSPVVVKILAEEEMEAIMGIGCLDSLDKAFSKVSVLGIPSVAVPLNICGCSDTDADMETVKWFLESAGPRTAVHTRTYLPLIRQTHRIFTEGEVDAFTAPYRGKNDGTAEIALDWLATGGKRLRPFVTLAAYKILGDGQDLSPDIKRIAVAIEAFHKASLIHDDIEDNDDTRYDRPAVHCAHGIPVAVNTGDYLIGLGYALIAEAAEGVSSEERAALVRVFSRAHVKLARGQGAELLWDRNDGLNLEESLQNYIFKTSPAFEAALAGGLILAGVYTENEERVRDFCRYLGAAFQIDNDLKDWKEDAAQVRPTVLLALALENCRSSEAASMLDSANSETIEAVYEHNDVIPRARVLQDRFRRHAQQVADDAPGPLSELMTFLIEVILG